MEQEKKRTVKTWRKWEKEFLFDNLDKMPIEDICTHLKRNERSVKLFLHRNRKDPRGIVKDNLLIRILTIQFKDPALFSPNRAFLNTVKIGQKRYWQIYKGLEKMKDEECKRITDFFQIPYEMVQEVRQTELFDEKSGVEENTKNTPPDFSKISN